jgi:hypothetical protein
MVASIKRIAPITRNQGVPVPGLAQVASWFDAIVLVANVAQAYVLPTDAAGNKGQILRISANAGPLFINFQGAAAVPGANIADGSSSIILRTDLGPVALAVPDGRPNMSVISPVGAIVTIEVMN